LDADIDRKVEHQFQKSGPTSAIIGELNEGILLFAATHIHTGCEADIESWPKISTISGYRQLTSNWHHSRCALVLTSM